MNACCKAYEINGVSHSIDCEIEELLRGKSPEFKSHEEFVEKYTRLENSSTVCVHCTGPIVAPVKNSFCSWSCYLAEVGS